MMVGNNLKDSQLQQIVDKTIMFHDKDGDGRISFAEFSEVCCYYEYYDYVCCLFVVYIETGFR